MLQKRILPNKQLWWHDPELPNLARKQSRSARNQPVAIGRTNSVFTTSLNFKPSRYWKSYSHLPSYTGAYFVELYPISSVAKRYGLSVKTREYWKNHILPDPFQALGKRNQRTLYWSRIQLVALDSVLRYLEQNGILTIQSSYIPCLDLLDKGCEVLERYYEQQYEEIESSDFDTYGVRKLAD